MSDQTLVRPMDPSTRTAGPGDPGEPSGAAAILERAAAWREVAREARRRCQRGAEAEQELQRRRNSSGQ